MTTKADIQSIIQENDKRRAILFSLYDPITGEGSLIERRSIKYSVFGKEYEYLIPQRMYEDFQNLLDTLVSCGSIEEFLVQATRRSPTKKQISEAIDSLCEIRFNYDFEYWAFMCAKIQDKETKLPIPFKLNKSQRKLLVKLEKMRLAGIPIRLILLKARQWGGSTLTQIYMAWIQIRLKTNWHSVIVADVEEQAKNIRGMYSRFAREYPVSLGTIELVPYERSTKSRIIKGRDCVISIGSAQKPNDLRSFDLAMCHISEAAFFRATPQKTPEDLVQTIRAAIADVPDSLVVMESTAKGVGNFFHREWLTAMEGRSGYEPLFIPWFEIERYQKDLKDPEQFIVWMLTDGYAKFLWSEGATLEGINWYFDWKRRENYDDWRMKSEFPSTSTEGFVSTGQRVFAPDYVQRARKTCMAPEYIGDISGSSIKGKEALNDIIFQKNDRGQLLIWEMPDKTEDVSDRYVVTVDIGGRTKDADYSVIKAFDRYWQMSGGKPVVVAVWRGHLDQDLVAWKAAQMAKFYNDALLVVESNSLDTEEQARSQGDHFLTILDEIVKFYSHIYARTDPEKVRQGMPIRYGFHTDRNTKPMIIDELNGALREESYMERDFRAPDEMDTYEIKPNGTYGAVEGCHDDQVIVTAIGVWISFKFLPLPKMITRKGTRIGKKIVSEASI